MQQQRRNLQQDLHKITYLNEYKLSNGYSDQNIIASKLKEDPQFKNSSIQSPHNDHLSDQKKQIIKIDKHQIIETPIFIGARGSSRNNSRSSRLQVKDELQSPVKGEKEKFQKEQFNTSVTSVIVPQNKQNLYKQQAQSQIKRSQESHNSEQRDNNSSMVSKECQTDDNDIETYNFSSQQFVNQSQVESENYLFSNVALNRIITKDKSNELIKKVVQSSLQSQSLQQMKQNEYYSRVMNENQQAILQSSKTIILDCNHKRHPHPEIRQNKLLAYAYNQDKDKDQAIYSGAIPNKIIVNKQKLLEIPLIEDKNKPIFKQKYQNLLNLISNQKSSSNLTTNSTMNRVNSSDQLEKYDTNHKIPISQGVHGKQIYFFNNNSPSPKNMNNDLNISINATLNTPLPPLKKFPIQFYYPSQQNIQLNKYKYNNNTHNITEQQRQNQSKQSSIGITPINSLRNIQQTSLESSQEFCSVSRHLLSQTNATNNISNTKNNNQEDNDFNDINMQQEQTDSKEKDLPSLKEGKSKQIIRRMFKRQECDPTSKSISPSSKKILFSNKSINATNLNMRNFPTFNN